MDAARRDEGGRAARGGRGARERILQAAEQLFYTRGIHATGVAALMEAAHVSPRTFYVHVPTKNALVEEYLRRFESEQPLAAEAALERGDQTAAQRPLAIFAPPESLGRQLAVIFEGANALAASSNDAEAFTDARRAAKTLLDIALTTTPEG